MNRMPSASKAHLQLGSSAAREAPKIASCKTLTKVVAQANSMEQNLANNEAGTKKRSILNMRFSQLAREPL